MTAVHLQIPIPSFFWLRLEEILANLTIIRFVAYVVVFAGYCTMMILAGVFLLNVCLSVSFVFVWCIVCLFSMVFYTFITSVQFVTIGGQH